MEEKLRPLIIELGNAINESLADSKRIAETIEKIKEAGYNVFLVLKFTLGFNKIENLAEENGNTVVSNLDDISEESLNRMFSDQDKKFLGGPIKIGNRNKRS
jgi:hypothetical protein